MSCLLFHLTIVNLQLGTFSLYSRTAWSAATCSCHISMTVMKCIGLEMQHRSLLEVCLRHRYVTVQQIGVSNIHQMWNEFWLRLLWFFFMPAWITQWQKWRESTNILGLELSLQPHSYMVRGHEIKKIPVFGVEGHDVMNGFTGWQLQCPLVSQGHVREEGQLWKKQEGNRAQNVCWITVLEHMQKGATFSHNKKFSQL